MSGYIIDRLEAELHANGLSTEEKRLALQTALHSKTFSRSEQLKSFLRFVCETENLRPGTPITEYVIGVEVLGRSEGYSPAEDSSVRTRAYELRHKLDHLYSVEAPNETVQIHIPKGSYTPQYLKVDAARETPEPKLLISPPIPRSPDTARRPPISYLSIVLCLVSVCAGSFVTWLATRSKTHQVFTRPDRVLAEAWGPLVSNGSSVLLCAATPLSLVVGPLEHHVFNSFSYPAPAETYPLFRQHRFLPKDGRLGLTFSDNMLAVGVLNAAMTCGRTLHDFGASYQFLPERLATASALRGRNAILFGAPIDSEAISRMMETMPLSVDFEPSENEFVIKDRDHGRIFVPKKDGAGDLSEVYGLITVQRSKDADGRVFQIVLFSGITSVGTQGAAEFYSSPTAMRKLQALFKSDGIDGFPGSYQAVVSCTSSNMLLLSYRYQIHRTINKNTD